MSKAIKFPDEKYLDSSSVSHKRKKLSDILDNKMVSFYCSENGDTQFSNSYKQIPFDEASVISSKLQLQSDGTIKIGDNIKTIAVSGATALSVVNDYDLRRLAIFKNNEIINRTQLYFNSYQSLSISPKIVEVKKGDIISMKITGNNSPSGSASNGSEVTYLTIEIIE